MKAISILFIAFVFLFVPGLANLNLPIYESSYAEEANFENASKVEEENAGEEEGQEEGGADEEVPPAEEPNDGSG